MRAYRLHKYTKLLQHLTYRQLKQVDFGHLEQLGIEGVGPRNKLIRLLDEVDVDSLDNNLTPESDTPSSEKRSPAAAAAAVAPVLIAQGRSTQETDQDGTPALIFDNTGAATIEAASPNGHQAPHTVDRTQHAVPVATMEAATVSEDSTACLSFVQTKSATHSLHTQENNTNSGQNSCGPSTLVSDTTTSFKLEPTVAEFTPTTDRSSCKYETLDDFLDKTSPPAPAAGPQTLFFWNGWFWQQHSRHLLPPPNSRPESFLPMAYPKSSTRGLAPRLNPEGQHQRSSTLLYEEISESLAGDAGQQEETMGSVVIEDDAYDLELPEGMRDLAKRLIRLVDELTADK